MARTLYLLHGLARSGKGATFHILQSHNPDIRLVKHADVLKDMTRLILREAGYTDETFIEECIESSRKEQKLEGLGGFTPREIMQYIGTEFRLNFNPELWNQITQSRYHYLMNDGTEHDIVVDDTRFEPEINSAKEVLLSHKDWKLRTIKIKRPNFKPQKEVRLPVPETFYPVYSDDILHLHVAEKAVDFLISEIETYSGSLDMLNGASRSDLIQYLQTLMVGVKEKRNNPQKHSSENGLDDSLFHIVLVNDGNIKKLKTKIKNVGLISDNH